MSYDIIKSIAIKGDKVYFTSASNNVRPRTFYRNDSPYFNEAYQKGGMHGLLKAIGEDVWNGNFHLQPGGSKICKLMSRALTCIEGPGGGYYSSLLRGFLDDEHGGEYLATVTEKLMDDPSYYPAKELSDLEALRSDKEAVLSICKNKPVAFCFAAQSIQEDRQAAREYIETCANRIMFTFPGSFTEDKELAMLALPHNGCIYRQLGEGLRGDKDIVRLAFDDSIDRRATEHLPDIIPVSLRQDKEFMREIISLCPALHVHRAKDILTDREDVLLWAKTAKFLPSSLQDIPQEHLVDRELQNIALERCAGDEGKMNKLREIYRNAGIDLPESFVDLTEKLRNAQDRAAAQTKSASQSKEQTR